MLPECQFNCPPGVTTLALKLPQTSSFVKGNPLFYFVEKLCIFSALSGIEMDVHHVPGHDNQEADELPRLDVETPVAQKDFISKTESDFPF